MNTEELYKRLLAEGCSNFYMTSHPHEGAAWAQSCGVSALDERNGVWRIYFTERGNDKPPGF